MVFVSTQPVLIHTQMVLIVETVVFGANISNSKHATNKTQSILVLGRGLIQK